MNKVLVINGPNLNLLGTREPEIYGKHTLANIESITLKLLKKNQILCTVEWFQSNSESEIVDKIQSLMGDNVDLLVINPGAYSHTSVAILDALKSISIAKIEVHLSHTLKREEFRHKKLTALGCDAVIEGLGPVGYFTAISSQEYKKKFTK
ncbi:MAG: 3-dehydroquinate dehydratase [Bdellovibrio sp.]|nr:3-dehydroquinate dehydratase [Bdellovibrio sp.]